MFLRAPNLCDIFPKHFPKILLESKTNFMDATWTQVIVLENKVSLIV